MPKRLTPEDLVGTKVRNVMHLNFGGAGYGYGFRCIEFPRIGYIERTYKGKAAEKAGTSFERIWTLDGAPMDSKEAALEGHAAPPALTAEERAVLDKIPAEFTPSRELARRIDAELGLPERPEGTAAASTLVFMALVAKGLAEMGSRAQPALNAFEIALGREAPWPTPTIRRRADDE